MTESVENRYARQAHAFPDDRRQSTALAVFGANDYPFAGAALVAGAAAMGLPVIGSDFHGPHRAEGHWLLGEYPELIAHVNPETNYVFIDPDLPAADLPLVLDGRANPWLVLFVHEPTRVHWLLAALARRHVSAPVLMVCVGPAGLVVTKYASPLHVMESMSSRPPISTPSVMPELAITAAGLVLNEVMLATPRDEGEASPIVGFYSLHRSRRIRTDGEPADRLYEEIATRPTREPASFAGRKLIMVGAGALGNWAIIPPALEGLKDVTIYDGDAEVAPHNINRQILLVDGVGKNRPKVDVLTEELAVLNPATRFRAIPEFVRKPGDLTGMHHIDALLCVPDNDEARLVCDDARRHKNLLLATAGSSAVGGQAIVRRPGQGCLRCLGLNVDAAETANEGQSCHLVQSDAVVSSNMVSAGLMISELREALAGRESVNLRFAGDSTCGNRLVRMISGTSCPHVDQEKALAS